MTGIIPFGDNQDFLFVMFQMQEGMEADFLQIFPITLTGITV